MLKRYNPKDFERVSVGRIQEIISESEIEGEVPPTMETHEGEASLEIIPTRQFQPIVQPDTDAVMEGCKFIQYCDDEREGLTEPEWYALAGILTHLPNGKAEFHRLSNGHPGYTKKDADAKFEHAATAIRWPRTCEGISGAFPNCPTCPNYKKVHTPVEIGYSKTAKASIESMLAAVSTDPGAPFTDESTRALYALKKYDSPEFARAWQRLKKEGVPLRELNRGMENLAQRLSGEDQKDFSPRDNYTISNGSISVKKRTSDGISAIVPLCNFNASIVAEVTHDDGLERKKYFKIEGTLDDGRTLRPIQVPASEFPNMNWAMQNWGAVAIIYSGQAKKDDLRVAIQIKSKGAESVDVYTHTGWKKLPGKEWAYLHSGGAIHSEGNANDVLVSLGEDRIGSYSLPEPPTGDDLLEAVKASIQILKIGPLEVTAPILAAIYRAPIGVSLPIDFSLFAVGRSGVFKSELAALAQAHYGQDFNSRNLPGNWTSTGNSLERQSFLLKDALFVVDDFSPRGGTYDIQTLHTKAERLLRGAGNSAGRGRMTKDAGLRSSNPPRSLIFSSGEDVPNGHSLRARTFIIDVKKGAVSSERLTEMQKAARDGKFARSMSAYLKWLAPRVENFKRTLLDRKNKIRSELEKDASHLRTADATANLIVSLQVFFEFVSDMGVLKKTEAESILNSACEAIELSAKKQKAYQQSEDEVSKFLSLLGAAIVSGYAHIADYKTGKRPEHESQRWGWDNLVGGNGQKIGWINGNELLLDPEPTMNVLRKVGQNGNPISVSKDTLSQRLADAKLIVLEKQGEVERKTLKRSTEGMRRRCWVFSDKSVLYPYLEDASVYSNELLVEEI